MSTYTSLKSFLENQDKTRIFTKKKSSVQGIPFLVTGIFIVATGFIPTIASADSVYYLMLITGLIMIITGILKTVLRKTVFVSAEHGELYEKRIGFDYSEKEKLKRMLEKGQTEEIKNLNRSQTDSLVLRIIFTGNFRVCYSQVEHFAYMEYQTVSDDFQHKYSEALALKLLK